MLKVLPEAVPRVKVPPGNGSVEDSELACVWLRLHGVQGQEGDGHLYSEPVLLGCYLLKSYQVQEGVKSRSILVDDHPKRVSEAPRPLASLEKEHSFFSVLAWWEDGLGGT